MKTTHRWFRMNAVVLSGLVCLGITPHGRGETKTETKTESEGKVIEMFDGKTLEGWKETDFAGKGEVYVEDGAMILGMGYMTGVNWAKDHPKMNYEISLEAKRVDGSDFFCGLTAPYNDSFFSLIVGGWGGGLVGISSLDGADASENETTSYHRFEKNKWYRIRLKVTEAKIEAWLDGEKIVDAETKGRKVSLRAGEIYLSRPLGLASYSTTAALKNIKLKKLDVE